MEKKYLLGIDAGTSLVKAVVFNFSGHECGVGFQKVAVESPKPAWAQQHPEHVWHATVKAIQAAVKQAAIESNEIAVIGPCGQGDGAWMMDKSGEPLTPACLWNDGRAANIVQEWERKGVLAEIYRINGTQFWPGAAACVLTWLRENDYQQYSSMDKLFCCKDWIKFKLTGTVTTDESDGSIPFFDTAGRRYSDRLLKITGLEEIKSKLAPVVPSQEIIGEVTAKAAGVTGLSEGTPVISGMMDVAANAIGAGVVSSGQALSIIGTTSMNMLVMDTPTFEPAGIGATTCHGIAGQWMRILGGLSGTPNLDWAINAMGSTLKDLARKQDIDLFMLIEQAVKRSPVGAQGVIFHPFLQGERAPFVNPDARAGFFGIHANTTQNDLIRSVFEGIALSSKDCYEKMGKELTEITLVGGGSKSTCWCQVLADAIGCKMIVPSGSQVGALGVAIAGGVGIGVYEDYETALDKCLKVEKVYEPSVGNNRKYNELYKLYSELLTHMNSYWDENRKMADRWQEES